MLDKISTKALGTTILACGGAAYGALQGTDSANEAFKVASWCVMGGAVLVGTVLSMLLVLRLMASVFPASTPTAPPVPTQPVVAPDLEICRAARTLLEEGERLKGENSTAWHQRQASREKNPLLEKIQAWDTEVAQKLGAHPTYGRFISESRPLTPLALGQNAIQRRCQEIKQLLDAAQGIPTTDA